MRAPDPRTIITNFAKLAPAEYKFLIPLPSAWDVGVREAIFRAVQAGLVRGFVVNYDAPYARPGTQLSASAIRVSSIKAGNRSLPFTPLIDRRNPAWLFVILNTPQPIVNIGETLVVRLGPSNVAANATVRPI